MFDTLIKSTFSMTAQMMANHPKVYKLPPLEEAYNTIIFRLSLCTHLLFLQWIREGSQPIIKANNIRNDVVDMMFAAYGTFFDGLLTKDQKQGEIYNEAKIILDLIRN